MKNSKEKIFKVVFITPLLLISSYSILFGETLYEYKINDSYKIETFIGGFLSCGESIRITKSKFGIFEKSIYIDNSICIEGINKIEILEFNKNFLKLLIYHDGEMDSENPYNYGIKKSW